MAWRPVTSVFPRGVLEPVLFYVFINDLDAEDKSTLSKFTDDTKLEGTGDSLKGTEALQRDLTRQLGNNHWYEM